MPIVSLLSKIMLITFELLIIFNCFESPKEKEVILMPLYHEVHIEWVTSDKKEPVSALTASIMFYFSHPTNFFTFDPKMQPTFSYVNIGKNYAGAFGDGPRNFEPRSSDEDDN
ncbi:hypothetical protein TNCV_3623681 [Trichonephila clavipes]|nr:hypothetical protein TNCV_3623681 [Trichonephila clavipes]